MPYLTPVSEASESLTAVAEGTESLTVTSEPDSYGLFPGSSTFPSSTTYPGESGVFLTAVTEE